GGRRASGSRGSRRGAPPLGPRWSQLSPHPAPGLRRSHPLDDPAGSAGRRDEGQARARPGGHTAFQVLRLIPDGAEALHRPVAAGAAAAHGHDGPPLRYFGHARAELTERDVLRSVDVAGVPLVLLPNVEQVEFGTPLAEVLDSHRTDRSEGADMDAKKARERLKRERADLAGTGAGLRQRMEVRQRGGGEAREGVDRVTARGTT